MPKAGRLADKAYCPADHHGCPDCPHTTTGLLLEGSRDVIINGRGAARVGDRGTQTTCCGSNSWMAIEGAERVIINGRAAHRINDATRHCGGEGKLTSGSPNVIIGGPPGSSQNNSEATGSIRVRIVFRDTREPLADEPYAILDAQQNVVRSGRTDAEGRIREHGLRIGFYTVKVENDWVLKL